MCDHKLTSLFALVVAAAALLGRAAHAAPARHVRRVQLADALNRTVCPMRVELDENPDRVPRRIKLMRCAAEPSPWCRAHAAPHACCGRRHGAHAHLLECVEVRDAVLVYYRSSATTAVYNVAVGCACMLVESAAAPALPSGPT